MRNEIVERSGGDAERAAYAIGVVDGLMWLMCHGPAQAHHLKDHMDDGDAKPFVEIALGHMDVLYRDHPNVWSHMRSPAVSTTKLLDVWPSCGPPPREDPPPLPDRWRPPGDPSLN